MKRIGRILATLAIALFSAVSLNAQDVAAATELFNAGANALNAKNYTLAIENFNKALTMAQSLGADGASIVNDTKALLPKIYMFYGQDLAEAKKTDEAIAQLQKAVDLARNYGQADIAKEAYETIPKVMSVAAADLVNSGKFPEAVAAYKKITEANPTDGSAFLALGFAESKVNNEEGAIAAFNKAIELGEKENGAKQLSTIYLKKAADAYGAKNWTAVLDNAKKSNDVLSSGMASKLAGLAAFNLKKYDDAISAFENYLKEDPTAKDKDNFYYYMATSYEVKKNTAKACEFYKKIIANPTFKSTAEYKVKTLQCK